MHASRGVRCAWWIMAPADHSRAEIKQYITGALNDAYADKKDIDTDGVLVPLGTPPPL